MAAPPTSISRPSAGAASARTICSPERAGSFLPTRSIASPSPRRGNSLRRWHSTPGGRGLVVGCPGGNGGDHGYVSTPRACLHWFTCKAMRVPRLTVHERRTCDRAGGGGGGCAQAEWAPLVLRAARRAAIQASG